MGMMTIWMLSQGMRMWGHSFQFSNFDWLKKTFRQLSHLGSSVQFFEFIQFECLSLNGVYELDEGISLYRDFLQNELSFIFLNLLLLHFFIIFPGHLLDQLLSLQSDILIEWLGHWNIWFFPLLNIDKHLTSNFLFFLIEIFLLHWFIYELTHSV